RRKPGRAGTTTRRESDTPRLASGVTGGRTNGAPLLISFENRDARRGDYAGLSETPRPGHADFVAMTKYGGFADLSGGGHFSGRLTVGLVAAGVVAKKLIAPASVAARLLSTGGSDRIDEAVAAAQAAGDSIGGLVEGRAAGLPAGLGEPFFDSVESILSHLLFAIPGVKGVEFGAGFAAAAMPGSAYNDRYVDRDGRTETNHSGGINGGLTNGNDMVFRVAVRPPASIGLPGRHDACIALRVPVIVESVAAVALADLMLLEQKVPRVWRSR
ncbi:MAG TPA: chorismate synthase, partial [Thermoanaerobaculia bacterium]|nr:chorismate synthase [Thermoanaerobaculia bacterium]